MKFFFTLKLAAKCINNEIYLIESLIINMFLLLTFACISNTAEIYSVEILLLSSNFFSSDEILVAERQSLQQ